MDNFKEYSISSKALPNEEESPNLKVCNPYDLTQVGAVSLVNWQTVNERLTVCEQVFKQNRQGLPAYQRIDILSKAAKLIASRQEELALLIAAEGGKPLIDARIEVSRAIDGVELCAKEISRLKGNEVPMDLTAAGAGRVAFSTKEPIGIVVAISAFNHPLNLIVHQVGPAVATGCPVLVKPALETPLSCKAFVDILHESGLPKAWCQLIVCEDEITEKLVSENRISFLSFIGSAKVGWMLRSKLAPGTRCALEHGGVAPVIIEETANVDTLIPSLIKGAFYHSGQVCVSVQRVFVPKSMVDLIAEKLAKSASQLIVGNATDEKTECGPLIRPTEVDRVEAWVNEAVSLGASLLTGGKRLSNTTYAPTVLLDPPSDAKVSSMEIFGPVVCLFGYDDINDAIDQANALDFAFQSSIFTNRLDVAMKAVRQLDAASVMVNDHTAFRVDWMPFGGRKHSGYNVGGIAYTMKDMSQDKMAVIKL